jgi:short subunit dehydrogenase-like uncharacterized protein
MADRGGWMIYGANGFTGHLVAVEAKRQGLHPVLAGRRAGPIEALAEDLRLPARVYDPVHCVPPWVTGKDRPQLIHPLIF